MGIKGGRLTISSIKLEDVYYMTNWGKHENLLLFDYNFPLLSDSEIKQWYYLKTIGIRKKYYGILNENNILIGYMGIKNIRRFKREATLGIVFDPNYVNQGYGTESINLYLNYYFNKMKMKRMYLDVAQFNKRAIQCYEKNGFKKFDVYLEEFFNQNLDLNSPYFLEEKSSFKIKNAKIYNHINKMKVDKKDFKKVVCS